MKTIKGMFKMTYWSLSIGINACKTVRQNVWKQLTTHKLLSA